MSSVTDKPTGYAGGKSTPLQAIIKIAAADQAPMGVVFGSKQILCEQEREYSFIGMSTLQALRKASEGTGYNVTLDAGVYNLWAPDLTQREHEVSTFRFPRFFAPPTTMADLGARLTGYVSTSIEGASGFLVDTLGNPEDEIVSVTVMTDLTGPQIANQIVKLGSKGIWIMRAVHSDTEAKQGSTVFNVYGYHDAGEVLQRLTCPPTVTPK